MPSRSANVIATSQQGSWLALTPTCGSCQACKPPRSKAIYVAQQLKGEVSVAISAADLWFVVFNSLLLPLFAFIAMILVADMLHLAEVVGIILASSCFILGVLLCRALPVDKLRINEVSNVEN